MQKTFNKKKEKKPYTKRDCKKNFKIFEQLS